MAREDFECCNLNDVIQNFYNNLKTYLTLRVKNNDLAEDILQEVMLKVTIAHQNNLEVKNLKAWLYQITRNTLVDYYRKNEKPVLKNEDELKDSVYYIQEDSFNISDYIIPMIELLPEKYSIPLMLSDIDNITQAEISSKLNLSLSATKMRIQRARKMLYNLFIKCCNIKYDKNGTFVNCEIKDDCIPLINLK